MSYDISLVIDTGHEETEVAYVGSYTYNVGDMYREALGFSLGELDGKNACDSLDILDKGIKDMQANPDKYKKMNPENGWGNYEGALEYLLNIRHQCHRYPKCTILVC